MIDVLPLAARRRAGARRQDRAASTARPADAAAHHYLLSALQSRVGLQGGELLFDSTIGQVTARSACSDKFGKY